MNQAHKKESWKISSCSGGFRQFTLEQTLKVLKNIGFKYIEGTTDGRAHLYEYIFNKKDPQMLEKLLTKYDIKLAAVSGGWSDFAVADQYLERQYQSVHKQLQFCQKFKIKILRIFASHLPGQYLSPSIIKRVIKNLKRITPIAKKYNVCLAIENHYGLTAKAEDILKIIEGVASPCLKVNFDAANFIPMREDPVKACARLLPHIIHLHLKDIQRSRQKPDYQNAFLTGRDIWRGYKFCPLGLGLVNYQQILEILLRKGYNGLYSIEYEDFSQPILGTKTSYQNLQRLLAKIKIIKI